MSAPSAARSGVASLVARAKVNLSLHVLGKRADGYHELDSLVVFPGLGDLVDVEPASGLSLTLDGPHGFALDGGADNLVLKAATALRSALGRPELGAALRLDKRLPVASGVGGGSADAAATLHLLNTVWGGNVGPDRLGRIGRSIGADVPVCLHAPRSALMRGDGDQVASSPAHPPFWLVLVNPGQPVRTPEVFQALDGRFGGAAPPCPLRWRSIDDFVAWLATARNDLEAPASRQAPAIVDVLAALKAALGCRFARMSGSGATCFGLFERSETALAASEALARVEPTWWVAAGPVDSGGGA